jgi:Ca-activated chloride channel homolog
MKESAVAGLLTTAGSPIPLKGVAIHVSGRGPASRVTVAQNYRNEESRPVEAVYTFPLPEEAAVCGFQVEQNGRVLRGRVEDKEKGLEEYDSALAAGARAFLLDQDRPNVFTAYVGNLRPQEEVVLRLSYVTPLQWHADGLQLIVPTVVSPRYFTAEQLSTMDSAELLHLTPPAVLGPLPYGFTLTLDLELPGPLAGVECPSHPFLWSSATAASREPWPVRLPWIRILS